MPDFSKLFDGVQTTAIHWRVAAPEHVDREVHQLALSENRSQTNMILRLVLEALRARREHNKTAPQS